MEMACEATAHNWFAATTALALDPSPNSGRGELQRSMSGASWNAARFVFRFTLFPEGTEWLPSPSTGRVAKGGAMISNSTRSSELPIVCLIDDIARD